MVALCYDPLTEGQVEQIVRALRGSYPIAPRALALLLLSGDEEVADLVRAREPAGAQALESMLATLRTPGAEPAAYSLARQRHAAAAALLEGVMRQPGRARPGLGERLSQAMMEPLTGLPLLAMALFGLYLFVGVFGAGTLVGLIEEGLFDSWLTPWTEAAVARWVPWESLRQLLAGEYGMIPLGLRYAVGIILPIVGTFFLAFSVIEDSGYLPRLAMLIDRAFKRIGLNGRAVIPMVLGFGCDTMATVVTRTLETRRERVIATLLLALAIPCSAQLGVILALLAASPAGLAVWIGVVTAVFLLVGFLTARLMPGERPSFFMELPPLRLPRPGNVLVKTLTRMEWYLREVLPVFLIISLAIWLGQLTGVFEGLLELLRPAVAALGLPQETALAFLFGFFRRDYGAAGLFDVQDLMDGTQRTVAAVTLTLFLPCVAQVAVMLKERGWKMTLGAVLFIFPFAFIVGWLLAQALALLGVSL